MRGRINFLGNTPFTAENVQRALNELWDSGTQNVTNLTRVINSSVSGGSGSVTISTDYRSDGVTIAAGSQTVTFSTAMSTTLYKVIAFVLDANGALTAVQPTSQSLTGFTVNTDFGGTLIYIALPVK